MRRKHYGVSALPQRMLKERRCNEFQVFVSYARSDDADGKVGRFIDALCLAHCVLNGQNLSVCFDRSEIKTE